MSIRAKLLLVIPLLVLLANTVTFFLFQSSTIVQRSYDRMMDRILAYKQSVEAADRSLQALYAHLLDPNPESRTGAAGGIEELIRRAGELERTVRPASQGAAGTGYLRLLDSLAKEEKAALSAAYPSDALSRYESAERIAGFVREEAQRLVDLELAFDQPIFRRIQEENARMNRLGAAVFVAQTALGVALAVWISRGVTDPVGRLVKAAKHVSEHRTYETPPDLPAAGKDELGTLSGAFRQMLADLKASARRDREMLEQSRLVKELELQALQSQIRPHFMYNSLNVLSKLALLEGAERTSDLIVSLSRMLRYNLRRLDEPVGLKDELEQADAYVAIQKARFRDRFRFETEIDESVLDTPIPPLTIQPLVENAFVHGIESLERNAVIRLSVRRAPDGRNAIVEIADNGAGMDEETRQALLRMDYEPSAGFASEGKSSGLGTRNVFRRLQLFCGRDDAVEIRSRPGFGTTIAIRIPLTKEETQTDVPIDDRG
ncbi:sensor histidine kinase [Cohnella massiliensis]|uniref:sensor histidine kinase n=1 Tax=Cohnella massiliensis TaxID=1816691 RepID=UPI0009BA6704|nr:histidine kinase [Cohnella massiliensis]